MIKISGLNKSFPIHNGLNHVLRNVNLTVQGGEIISIVGANGCGKSTLFRIIAGLLPREEGELILGEEGGRQPYVAIVQQRYRESLFPWRTVRDNINLPFEGPRPYQSKTTDEEFINEALESLGIQALQNVRPGPLSGGQAQLVALARTFAAPWPNILLLDEPFSALDGKNLMQAAEIVVKITRERKTATLIITHDIDIGILIADRIAIMGSGSKSIIDVIDSPFNGSLDPSRMGTDEFIDCKKNILQTIITGGMEN